MKFQVLGTHSRKFFYDPNLDRSMYRTGNGFGYSFNIDYTTDRHGWFAEATGRTSDYRADAGFTCQTDSNTFFFANRLSTKSNPKAAIIRTSWSQFARYGMDWKGRTQNALIGNNLNFNLQGNMFIYTEFGVQFEKIYEHEFGPNRNLAANRPGAFFGAPTRSATQPYFSVNANKTVNKQLSVYGFVGSIFNSFDYDFGGAKISACEPGVFDISEQPAVSELYRRTVRLSGRSCEQSLSESLCRTAATRPPAAAGNLT